MMPLPMVVMLGLLAGYLCITVVKIKPVPAPESPETDLEERERLA